LKVPASLAASFQVPSWRLGPRLARTPRFRHPADPRIPSNYKLAGAQGRLFEIWRIHGKDLPARHLLPQYRNRSHVRKLSAQGRMVFPTNSEPHPIVGTLVMLVAQYKDNLVVYVHCQAAKHGVGYGQQLCDRGEHKLMWDNLTPLERAKRVAGWERGHIAIGLRHRTHHKRAAILAFRKHQRDLQRHSLFFAAVVCSVPLLRRLSGSHGPVRLITAWTDKDWSY